METAALLGSKVFGIQQNGSGPRQLVGTVTGTRGDLLAVTFAEQARWEANGVILVTGDRGARRTARAQVVQEKGAVTVFRLQCDWQSFDARANPRYPTHLSAKVRASHTTTPLTGTVVDVSMGGMAVIVATRPAGRDIEVSPMLGVYSATLPCQVTQAGECDGETVLHLRFGELSAPQQAFVRHLVGSARAALLEAEARAS